MLPLFPKITQLRFFLETKLQIIYFYKKTHPNKILVTWSEDSSLGKNRSSFGRGVSGSSLGRGVAGSSTGKGVAGSTSIDFIKVPLLKSNEYDWESVSPPVWFSGLLDDSSGIFSVVPSLEAGLASLLTLSSEFSLGLLSLQWMEHFKIH